MMSSLKINFYKSPNIKKYLFHVHLCRSQCSVSYKNTLLLPRNKFQHKIKPLNIRERDRTIESQAKFDQLYQLQRELNKTSEFILHDGPPYANGSVHIGHAVNKILKDITVRCQLLNGKKVHFVPGWDCHGLPIELKVLKENNSKLPTDSSLSVRKRAFAFSQKTKEQQMTSFKEWGILADWEASYFTCDTKYVIQQLKIFQDLYEKGIIFRDYKPVYWSPQNRTSLAEAELEYNSCHTSPSVYLKLKVQKCPDLITEALAPNTNVYLIIWTTTPWSLPANQAVCYSADKKYCIVFCKDKNEFYLIAEEMVHYLKKAIEMDFQILKSFEGDILKNVTYEHPVSKCRECILLPAHHVTMDKGTGLVHMAPNHGFDDYIVAKKHDLLLDPCIVNADGCYSSEAGEEFEGKNVLENGSSYVLDLLKNDILHTNSYIHSYPYDWRSKTPVIIRSCHQWFINVGHIREKAIACLEDVNIIPGHLKKAFQNQISTSPHWCISRQRSWGVPIPAFYGSSERKPIIHSLLTDHLCNLIKSQGIHCWWELNSEQLLPLDLKNQLGLEEEYYQKSSDIMDIWLDSGLSWKCVLPDPHVSDVCIEGLDQIRGWFYSSLLTSVAIRDKAPYRSLVLHGFTTDAAGRKMSKSEGNVVSPSDILCGNKKSGIPAYGIDVLRWWVAAHACHSENTPIKNHILEECSQNINKLRNVFKFLLGSIDDFEFKYITDASEMRPLDLYMLHKVLLFSNKITQQYSDIQYKNIVKEIVNFVTNDVSSFYCTIIKDRLYCDAMTSKERVHCQTVLSMTLNSLIQCIAPICPHLASEVLLHHPDKKLSEQNVFLCKFPKLSGFLEDTIFPSFIETANVLREVILGETKASESQAFITCSPLLSENLQKLNTNTQNNYGLAEFLQVSSVFINETPQSTLNEIAQLKGRVESLGKDGEYNIVLAESQLHKCPRCRLYKSEKSSELCSRCDNVINICKFREVAV